MQCIATGKPLHPGVREFEEGTHYNFTAAGHSLILSIRKTNPSHVNAVKQGEVVLGLALREQAIFLLSKFGPLPWRVAHYNWWLNPPVTRPDPWVEVGAFDVDAPIGVVLVEAGNGIVQAIRSIRPPEEFARLLYHAIAAQIRSRFDPWRYRDLVEPTLKRQSEDCDLIKEAVCMCICDWGGDPL